MRSSGFDPVTVEIFSRRLRIVSLFILAVFAALVLRLWFLQVVHGHNYRIQSENNRIHLQDIPPFRGMIFDRKGTLLVDNRPSYNLYVTPENIQDSDKLLENLRGLIGLDPKGAAEKLSRTAKKYPFKPILMKRNLTREELAVVETNLFNLAGVMIQVSPQRSYNYEQLASHLIGYLGEISDNDIKNKKYPDNKQGDFIGKYGVEGRWQRFLNGRRGGEQVEVDAAGRTLRVISRKPPSPGSNIYLTIDKEIQRLAEEGLRDKKGAIVAMNPNNGEIYALASSPGFDPNLFVGGIKKGEWRRLTAGREYPLQNRALAGQYPPGSVFKIVVSLAGFQEGIIDPNEEIFCNGTYALGNHIFRCWRKQGHGRVSFHRALVESCDVYFYKIGRRLGVDKIAHYAKMCGLGKKTNFELGGERSGLIPTSQWKLKRWKVPWQAGETISTSIGQSFVLVTPIQVAGLISAVFNGGRLYQPKVIKSVGKESGDVYHFSPRMTGRIEVKADVLEMVKKALVGVVNEPRGTGSKAKVKNVLVAGKTGTAQVINLEAEKKLKGGESLPSKFNDHAWFVALAPADDPRLALAILVENGGHGGSAAAPIAQVLIQAFLGREPGLPDV